MLAPTVNTQAVPPIVPSETEETEESTPRLRSRTDINSMFNRRLE
jgi:hypothetical protein